MAMLRGNIWDKQTYQQTMRNQKAMRCEEKRNLPLFILKLLARNTGMTPMGSYNRVCLAIKSETPLFGFSSGGKADMLINHIEDDDMKRW